MTKLHTTPCGDTLYVYDDAAKAHVDAMIEKRLLAGDAKTNPDGSREWIVDEMVVNTSKEASGQYTWAADGNRVLYHRVRHILHRDGRHERAVIRKVYKRFE